MARLRITEAAKATGVSRVTLFRHIKDGTLSRSPDGTIDTAELLRAGFMLQTATQLNRNRVKRTATSTTDVASQARFLASEQVIAAIERERDLLQRELNATREMLRKEQESALERERTLLHLLEQAQTQSQRLLEMPRQTPWTEQQVSRILPHLRQRILEYIRQAGRPVQPSEVQEALGLSATPRHIMRHMATVGVLRRVKQGVYEAVEKLP